MGKEKEFEILKDDYRRMILNKLFEIKAIEKCPCCGIEYLTGKEEPYIYAAVTTVFKKEYEDKYDNALMRSLIKEILSERFFGHKCEK